jgi:hypothetical protein
MKPKKIPMRMCVGCREMKEKRELIRVVRSPEGEVSLDATGKKSGRGAYVCRSAECLKRAIKQRQLERQLDVTLPAETAEALNAAMAEIDGAGKAAAGNKAAEGAHG